MQVGTVFMLSTFLYNGIEWMYNGLIHKRFMSQDMTGKEKLLFIASFIWAMHWGVRLTTLIFSTLEFSFF